MENDKNLLSTEETESNIKESTTKDTLEALLFDSEDSESRASTEEDTDFEAFMAEYRTLISKTLPSSEKESAPVTEEDAKKEYEEEYLISPPKKQQKKKQKVKKAVTPVEEIDKVGEWDDDITLDPEEYEGLEEEGNEFIDEVIEEEPAPDFDLGESNNESDNKFQLSINFDTTSGTVSTDDNLPKSAKYDPEKPRAIDWVFDITEMFVIVLAIVMLLTAFVFKHSVVEGASMNNTLSDGDHLIISNLFYTPQRGDVIVFEDYSTILKKPVVKRVIALPGETVEVKVDSNGNVVVYIDGEMLEEEYAYNAKDSDISEYYAPITLGEDEIFVMGDNRYHSTDSRHSGVGPIKIDSILGKVLFRFFPFDSFGGID